MRKSFSFVFMGALGFTVAVGASSFSPSALLNFQNFGIQDVVNGVGSHGFKFSGDSARFVKTGDDVSVSLSTIGPFDSSEKIKGLTAKSSGPLPLQSPLIDLDPFFSIEADAFGPFEFVSAELGGGVFDLSARGLFVRAFGHQTGSGFFEAKLPSGIPAGTVGASAFGLAGTPLTSLGFSLGSSSTGIQTAFSDGASEVTELLPELLIDDIEVVSATTVPVPASALLLGSALLGAGAFARRKKRT